MREVMTQSLILPARVTQTFSARKENLFADGVSKWVKVPDSQKPKCRKLQCRIDVQSFLWKFFLMVDFLALLGRSGNIEEQ